VHHKNNIGVTIVIYSSTQMRDIKYLYKVEPSQTKG